MTMDIFHRPTTRYGLNGSRAHLPRRMTENDSSRVGICFNYFLYALRKFLMHGKARDGARILPRRREGEMKTIMRFVYKLIF